MKIIGIIAEYNPFHNGHAYQIKKIKEELQADYVVVAMSGNFVQRGAPSIIDKYSRTEMALNCGADLVLELPVLWATASAEHFAMAGVTLFDKMGCVDGICFGAETDDLHTLSKISSLLIEEPPAFRHALSSYLKEGLSFPVARSKALCDYFANWNDYTKHNTSINPEVITSILNAPNNILAIEYLKALKRRHSSMTPYIIKREGAGYHEETIQHISSSSLNDDILSAYHRNFATTNYIPTASATAIRKELSAKAFAFPDPNAEFSYDTLIDTMPDEALTVLKNYITKSALIFTNDFSSILCYKLLCSDTQFLSTVGDSTTDFANRMIKNRSQFINFEQYCELCKRKEITYSRISRIFTHLLLNITEEDYIFGKSIDYIPYLRILGFKKSASSLLKELKQQAQIPIISKLANAASLLPKDAMQLLEKDIFAANLYAHTCTTKTGILHNNEFSRTIVSDFHR